MDKEQADRVVESINRQLAYSPPVSGVRVIDAESCGYAPATQSVQDAVRGRFEAAGWVVTPGETSSRFLRFEAS
jgi:hypothetical protein